MLTWLRIVVSCLCLVLCVLFVMLWVRSYFKMDLVASFQNPTQGGWEIVNFPGMMFIQYIGIRKPAEPAWRCESIWTAGLAEPFVENILGFNWRNVHGQGNYIWTKQLTLPHWSLVLVTGSATYFARPKPRWQFALRELFVLSTIGAITVGTLAVVLRAISS